MSDSCASQLVPPDPDTAVRKFLDAERRKVRDWAAGIIKETHAQRDRALQRLDKTASTLGVLAPKVSASQRKSKRKRNRSAAALAAERREAILRFLLEQGRPMALREIRQALRLSEFSIRSALKRLVEERKVIRTGTGSATQYQARPDDSSMSLGAPAPSPDPGAHGTAQGRILTIVEDRGSASLEELAQATRLSSEQVERECGALILEGEMQMARPNGRSVYVLKLNKTDEAA